MPRVYKRNTRTRYIICSKLTLKTRDTYWCLVNFEHDLNVILMSILLTLNRQIFARNPCFNTSPEQNVNRFTAFIVDCKHILHLVLVFLLLTLSKYSIAGFDLSYSSHRQINMDSRVRPLSYGFPKYPSPLCFR